MISTTKNDPTIFLHVLCYRKYSKITILRDLCVCVFGPSSATSIYVNHTVNEQNPAPPRMILPLFTGFQPSQVIPGGCEWDF